MAYTSPVSEIPRAVAYSSPVPGILSLLAGTLAASLLIPEYVEPAGALFWPALAFTVALVFPLLQRSGQTSRMPCESRTS